MNRNTSAVLTGLGIGLTNIAAFRTAGRGIGVSSVFESVAARAERDLGITPTRVNRYLVERENPPMFGWDTWLVAGTLVGGLIDSRLGGGAPRRAPGRPAWAAFAGGALAMVGARMAGGCTSGHCVTGTAQLATSSWTFTPVMAAAAAATAKVLRDKGIGRIEQGRPGR